MKYMIPILTLLLAAPFASFSAVRTEAVDYSHNGVLLEGFLAYDDAVSAKRPGVLIIHEWTGINEYVKGRAIQLAELGYIAFAPDIYGKGIRPQNAQEASKQATIYRSDRSLMRARAAAGFNRLKSFRLVDADQIAAIGYCFGGGVALELARSGADLSGVVSFHGNLDTPNPEDGKNIRAKVLVLHGADDPFVPKEQVDAFQNEMRNAGVDWQFIAYGNAVHAFTNPASGSDNSRGAAYNKSADRRSFDAMLQFFSEIFK